MALEAGEKLEAIDGHAERCLRLGGFPVHFDPISGF
jgi:hypothetical protein